MHAGGGRGEGQAKAKQSKSTESLDQACQLNTDVSMTSHKGKKKATRGGKKPQLDTLSKLVRTGESGGLWEMWGGELQTYRSTVDR